MKPEESLKIGIRYYKFKNSQRILYFRVNWNTHHVTQVNVWGKKKRGRPNMRGVYNISWNTWLGITHNLFQKYTTLTTEKLYLFHRDQIIQNLHKA